MAVSSLSRMFEHPLYDKNIWTQILEFAPVETCIARVDLARGMEPPRRPGQPHYKPDLSLLKPERLSTLKLFSSKPKSLLSSQRKTLRAIEKGQKLQDIAFLTALIASPHFPNVKICIEKFFMGALEINGVSLFNSDCLNRISLDFFGRLLTLAVQKGQSEIVLALIDSPRSKDLPSCQFLQGKRLSLIDALSQYPAAPFFPGENRYLGRALAAAAENDRADIAHLFFAHPNTKQRLFREDYNYALVAASAKGHSNTVKELLSFDHFDNPDPDFLPSASLQSFGFLCALCCGAVRNLQADVIEILLDYLELHPEVYPIKGISISALKEAVLYEHWDLAHFFISYKRFEEIHLYEIEGLVEILVKKAPFDVLSDFLKKLIQLERIQEIEDSRVRRKILKLAKASDPLLEKDLKAAWPGNCCTIL